LLTANSTKASIVHHDPSVVEGLLEDGLVIVHSVLNLVNGVLNQLHEARQSIETSHDFVAVVPVLLFLVLGGGLKFSKLSVDLLNREETAVPVPPAFVGISLESLEQGLRSKKALVA
jgi:hypothetical protein